MVRTRKIIPVLWFDEQAEEAAQFYTSLFRNSRITDVMRTAIETPSGLETGRVLTVAFELDGQPYSALNGGPHFRFNPAVSLFVNADTAEEVDSLFARLSEGGSVMMPLQSYPFSERFGWVSDRFGLSWQINLGGRAQKVTPALMFTGAQAGRAEEAIGLYTSLFEGSGIAHIEHYGAGDEGNLPGSVKRAIFHLGEQEFAAMDSAFDHGFGFNEAISLMIPCESQQDVDALWAQLSKHPEAEQCGWCKDAFGVSWQVTPAELMDMLQTPDREQARRVMEAFMPMGKLELEPLRAAFRGD